MLNWLNRNKDENEDENEDQEMPESAQSCFMAAFIDDEGNVFFDFNFEKDKLDQFTSLFMEMNSGSLCTHMVMYIANQLVNAGRGDEAGEFLMKTQMIAHEMVKERGLDIEPKEEKKKKKDKKRKPIISPLNVFKGNK